MKAAIDYKKANSELTGVDTFEGILGYIVATVCLLYTSPSPRDTR